MLRFIHTSDWHLTAGKFFDDSGKLDAGIEGILQKFIDAYAAWVERHLGR